jgi:hypothetical protein
MKKRTLLTMALLAILCIGFNSCSKNDENDSDDDSSITFEKLKGTWLQIVGGHDCNFLIINDKNMYYATSENPRDYQEKYIFLYDNKNHTIKACQISLDNSYESDNVYDYGFKIISLTKDRLEIMEFDGDTLIVYSRIE